MGRNLRRTLSLLVLSAMKSYVNPRMIIALLMAATFCMINSVGYHKIYDALVMPVNVFEPYIALFNNFFYMLFMTIGILLLLCDAPFFEKGEALILYRVGRVRWFAAKVFYIAATVLLYQLFVMVVQILLVVKEGFYSMEVWSDISKTAASGSQQLSGYGIRAVPSNIILAMDPGKAMIYTITLAFIYFNVLAMLIFVINLKFQRIIGVLAAMSIWVVGYLLFGIGEWMAMYSPLQHAMLVYHNIGVTWMMGQPTTAQSYCVLCILWLLLMLLALLQIHNHSFRFGE